MCCLISLGLCCNVSIPLLFWWYYKAIAQAKEKKASLGEAPGLHPTMQSTGGEWVPLFHAHWSLNRAATSSRLL